MDKYNRGLDVGDVGFVESSMCLVQQYHRDVEPVAVGLDTVRNLIEDGDLTVGTWYRNLKTFTTSVNQACGSPVVDSYTVLHLMDHELVSLLISAGMCEVDVAAVLKIVLAAKVFDVPVCRYGSLMYSFISITNAVVNEVVNNASTNTKWPDFNTTMTESLILAQTECAGMLELFPDFTFVPSNV